MERKNTATRGGNLPDDTEAALQELLRRAAGGGAEMRAAAEELVQSCRRARRTVDSTWADLERSVNRMAGALAAEGGSRLGPERPPAGAGKKGKFHVWLPRSVTRYIEDRHGVPDNLRAAFDAKEERAKGAGYRALVNLGSVAQARSMLDLLAEVRTESGQYGTCNRAIAELTEQLEADPARA